MVKVNYIFERAIIKSEEIDEMSGVLVPREGEYVKFDDKQHHFVDFVVHSHEKLPVPGVPNHLIKEEQRVISVYLNCSNMAMHDYRVYNRMARYSRRY